MAQMPEAIILRKTEETKAGMTYCMADVKTNADRIRSMTDEELAEKMSGLESFALTCGGGWLPEKWLDWLRQEANDVGR